MNRNWNARLNFSISVLQAKPSLDCLRSTINYPICHAKQCSLWLVTDSVTISESCGTVCKFRRGDVALRGVASKVWSPSLEKPIPLRFVSMVIWYNALCNKIVFNLLLQQTSRVNWIENLANWWMLIAKALSLGERVPPQLLDNDIWRRLLWHINIMWCNIQYEAQQTAYNTSEERQNPKAKWFEGNFYKN